MMSRFVFNGKSSRDFNLTIERLPESVHPMRRGDAYRIAGRNGTEYEEDGTFENYIQPFKISFHEFMHNRGVYAASRDIAAWLLSSSGFCRLEDTYELEYFRLARFAGPLNVEAVLRRSGRAVLEFECKPERFLKSGEDPVTVFENVDLSTLNPSYATTSVVNPTLFKSVPLIKITGSGTVNFSVESESGYMNVRILLTDDLSETRTVCIDCSSHKMYEETFGANWSAYITFNGSRKLAVLAPGSNSVTLSGTGIDAAKRGVISKVDFIPRWWTA